MRFRNTQAAVLIMLGALAVDANLAAAWSDPQQSLWDKAELPPALSPEQSLAAMRIRPDMAIELVACEPLVTDPIALDWGPDGRLWVVEMGDYPEGLDDAGRPGGK